MPRLAFPSLLLAAFVASPALAQQAEGQAEHPEIVVTGQGLRQTALSGVFAISVIQRDRDASSASGRIEDVLGNIAGLQQFRRSDSRSANPTAQGMTQRGLGGNASSRTLVLLDGVPMTDPFFGHVPFSALPFERLHLVTVTGGAGSGAFSAGAVAGTVEMFSANPQALPLGEAALAFNDRGESELSASLAPRLGSGFAVLSGRWDHGRGFWTTPPAQRGAASARARFDSWSTSLRGVVPVSDTLELQARALLYNDNRTLRFAGADSHQEGQDASLRLVGRGDWEFEVLGYVQARDFSNAVISATSFRKTLDQLATPSTGLGGKIELRPPVGAGRTLNFGIDWRRVSGEMAEIAYSGATGAITARRRAGGANDDLGLFAGYEHVAGALTLSGSARLDQWWVRGGHFEERSAAGAVTNSTRFADRSGSDLTLRGGAELGLGEGFTIRASVYSGLRQPTLNELYRPFVVFPITTRANATLANEKLFGFEGGVEFKQGPLEVQATLFDNRVRQAIANVTIGTNLRERRNVDAVHSRGMQLTAKAMLGQFSWDGSVSLLDPRMEGSGASAALNGMRPAQVPLFAMSTTLSWRPGRNWLLAATLRHLSSQFEDDLQTDRLPAQTTIDAYATIPLAKWAKLVVRAENIGDVQIVSRNQAGSLDLGTPRTLWAGLRFSIGR